MTTGQKYPALRTERFNIFSHEIPRHEINGDPRTVFQAWHHSADVPKPVCIITVWEMRRYVEWVHVDEMYRRQGVATEVVMAIEKVIPGLTIEGVTEAGEAFCDHYNERFPSLFRSGSQG